MIGSQEPRIKIEPERISTDGADACELMKAYSVELYKWQALIVDCWLGKDSAGKYNVTSAGISIARQNGKNVCIEAREFYGLVINGEKILHTAHQVRTAEKSFKRLVKMFTNDNAPEVKDLVKTIHYANGKEAIELKNGGVIEFTARSRQAARGYDGFSLIVLDEAQELTDDQLEAIMATLAASTTGTRQIIYAGTPPYPNCPGTVFRRRRKNAMTNPGKHDSWHEWSAPGENLEDIDTTTPDLWYMANPSLGLRLSEEFTGEECRNMSKDGFARERLGWWAPEISENEATAIDLKAWTKCKSDKLKPDGKTAFGVKFSADGTLVTLCGAVIPNEGPARISVIEAKPTGYGLQWLSEWLNARYDSAACVVIDGRNGVDLLVDRISETWRAKDCVIVAKTSTVIAAATLLITAVNEQAVTWYAKQELLNESAQTSTKRRIGGGYGFGGDNSGPVEAAALALWGAKNSKRNPGKAMKIG